MSRRRPNILLLMCDQLAAAALPFHGNGVVKAPNLAKLAARSAIFDKAYCNSPICAPSRFSMLSGRLPTAIGAYDNAAEFPASVPTLAHYLCALGYGTILSGKMHFIGPDQLHGFEERLTTDIYPSDFTWTPNWLNGPRDRPSGISMQGVIQAGPCIRTLQMDYDDEVEFHAVSKLYGMAREPESKPFFLTVSFSHPHTPFTIHSDYWNRYEDHEIDEPAVPPIPVGERDMHSRWLHYSHLADRQTVTAEHVRASRRAYYAMISYVDDKIGRILAALEETGFSDQTIIVFCSDHGEMLGERGMWYKQNFFESSARVPFLISWPGRCEPRRVSQVVSLVDLLPTLLDLVTDNQAPEAVDPLDGVTLTPLIDGSGGASRDSAISEYTDMGVCAPCRMIRRGRYKYIYTHGYPAQLYDLESDPHELADRRGADELAEVEVVLRRDLLDGWNPDAIMEAVLASQRRRLFLNRVALQSGRFPDWSFQAFQDDKKRFVRGGGAAGAKAMARFPYIAPLPLEE